MNGGGRGKKEVKSNDEVEMLLRATEDELLLNLSVDSHMSHVSPSYLDSDLDRRFQSLKSSSAKRSPAAASVSKPQTTLPLPTTATSTGNKKRDDSVVTYDDLLSRFANLKGSAPVPASISSNSFSDDLTHKTKGSGEVDNDEVEKLIQWAIDAARLDPSPPTDSEDDDNDEAATDEDDTDEDDPKKRNNSKGKKKIQK